MFRSILVFKKLINAVAIVYKNLTIGNFIEKCVISTQKHIVFKLKKNIFSAA